MYAVILHIRAALGQRPSCIRRLVAGYDNQVHEQSEMKKEKMNA